MKNNYIKYVQYTVSFVKMNEPYSFCRNVEKFTV